MGSILWLYEVNRSTTYIEETAQLYEAITVAYEAVQGEDGVWTLTDLESKSGTYVNGMKIKQQRLRNNDEIRIGKKTLYIRRVKPQNV